MAPSVEATDAEAMASVKWCMARAAAETGQGNTAAGAQADLKSQAAPARIPRMTTYKFQCLVEELERQERERGAGEGGTQPP